jgi:predicted O-linked N-acetylglucosamine transferase (SPINDLY family)
MSILLSGVTLLLLILISTSTAADQVTVDANGRVVQQQQERQKQRQQHGKTKKSEAETQALLQQLKAQFMSTSPEDPEEQQMILRAILDLDPHNSHAHFHLGLLMFSSLGGVSDESVFHLEQGFDTTHGPPAVPMPSENGMFLAMFLGRYWWEDKDYQKAFDFYQMALQATTSTSQQKGTTAKTCVEASLATMLHPFPNTTQQADEMYEVYMKSARNFLQRRRRQQQQSVDDHPEVFNDIEISMIPGAANDPYVHCILTLFHLSFYYRADVAEAARLHYQVATTVWPQLNYISPLVAAKKPTIPPHQNHHHKPCVTRKIKLGIASGFLSPGSPVSADFGGVMQRLDRDTFEITYIHFLNSSGTPTDRFVRRHGKRDTLLELGQDHQVDINQGAWPTRFHSTIEALQLDVLLYLDLTMNAVANRVAMARLAPVQANSHGHPVTSGIANVDYYISWGAAELPYLQAKTHYSEELILLDSNVPHQFYLPRMGGGISMLDGGTYEDKTVRIFFREALMAAGTLLEGNKNLQKPFMEGMFTDKGNKVRWYTCMQKPHKFMPEMDELLCGVLRQDPDSILILHQPDTVKLLRSFEQRLEASHCDMGRVYFLPALSHHVLLALYQVSTLILDSYPAGGCTTTREALELSKVVVTLPARLLGGRWSYAYYQMLEDSTLNEHVIATSPEDYIEKAVALGRDEGLRTEMERRIQTSLHHLYRSWDAVKSWEKALLTISPVEKRETCEA